MNDYFSRRPILNRKLQLYGYHLILGQTVRSSFIKAGEAGEEMPGRVRLSEILGDLAGQTLMFLDFFEELVSAQRLHLPTRKKSNATVVLFSKATGADVENYGKVKAQGYMMAIDSALFNDDGEIPVLPDIIAVDFPRVRLARQDALLRKYKNKAVFLAYGVDNWDDFKLAKDMGFELLQGSFFLQPTGLHHKRMKPLDASLISIIYEMDAPEPSFKKLSDLIEHDLGLSYRLMRLVNSAYMSPKYPINSISQALTYIGTRELHEWISMLLFDDIKSEANCELVKVSIIRGKLMALISQELRIPHSGTEPFFTGLFSLIDVIMNRDMADLLSGLPLSDDVKSALRGENNHLRKLLSFIVSYERAEWQKIDGKYPLDTIEPARMAQLYLEALRWSTLLDD